MASDATTELDLHYSDGIAAARTMIALQSNPAALQRRLPSGWELAPYAGDDLRGTSLRGANMLVLFHEVYAVRTHDGQSAGLPQLSYIAFISQARNQASGVLVHVHWFLYTEDPSGVPGKYRDAKLADITRSQTFSKERRGETEVRERFSAVADSGAVDVVRSDPLKVDRVSEISLKVTGELEDVFDGNERIVAVVIERPYMRQVYIP